MPLATRRVRAVAFVAALLAAGSVAGCGSGDDQPAAAGAASTTATTSTVPARGLGGVLVAVPQVVTVSMRCLGFGKSVETVLAVPGKDGATLRVRVPAAHRSFTLQPGEHRAVRTDVPSKVAVRLTQRVEPATHRLGLRVAYKRLPHGGCFAARVSLVENSDSNAR